MAYGAVGDGLADDTAALNAACDAARSVTVDGGVTAVYLPQGTYKVSGPINVFNVFLRGDGIGASKISVAHDWASSPNGSWVLDQQPSANGVGIPANGGAVGPTPSPGTWIEDVWVSGPGRITAGQIPCNLSGIRVGQGAGHSRVRVDGCFAGAFVFTNREKLFGPGSLGGNYYGVYFAALTPNTGDQVLADLELTGCAWASIGVSSGTTLARVALRALTLGTSPFGIYVEEAGPGSTAMAHCVLSRVSFTSCGNGNIFVNGPAGSGGDVQSCIFQGARSTNALDPSTAVGLSSVDARGRTIGRGQAAIDLHGGSWTANTVQGCDPAALPAAFSSYQAMIACGGFSGGTYAAAAGSLDKAAQDGRRFVLGPSGPAAIIMHHATACRLMNVGGSAVGTGALLEIASSSQLSVQTAGGTGRGCGVAMHPANPGDSVVVAHSGLATVACGPSTLAAGDALKPDSSHNGCVMTAALTDTNVVGVAQTGSGASTVTALLQGL